MTETFWGSMINNALKMRILAALVVFTFLMLMVVVSVSAH